MTALPQPRPASAADMVARVDKLVALPEIYWLVRERLQDPQVEMHELGRLIQQDVDLTARLLKLVNSAAYGFPGRVDTVTRAITLVGLRELEYLVLAGVAFESFARLPIDQINVPSFWRHSVFTALVARGLARVVGILHPERLFVAGLLHDLGRLVMCLEAPQVVREVMARREAGEDPNAVECELLGFDHARLGAALAQSWRFPVVLVDAIAHHHHPGAASKGHLEACILHVADVVSLAVDAQEEDDFRQYCDAGAWNRLGLDQDVVRTLIQDALMDFLETLELITPGMADGGSL